MFCVCVCVGPWRFGVFCGCLLIVYLCVFVCDWCVCVFVCVRPRADLPCRGEPQEEACVRVRERVHVCVYVCVCVSVCANR